MAQTTTSASTTRKQTPKIMPYVLSVFGAGSRILDFGGGRYDDNIELCAKHGVTLEVYDPYNRSAEHNKRVLAQTYDAVICCNVLNVLTDDALLGVVDALATATAKTSTRCCYISVYERDKSGVGCFTGKDQYQRNEPLVAYMPLIERRFGSVRRDRSIVLTARVVGGGDG